MSLIPSTAGVAGLATTVVVPASTSEILTPFQFEAGALATVTLTYQRAVQHLLSLAMTSPSERVMRPTYGVGLRSMVFETSNVITFQQAATALQSAFAASESSIATISVDVVQQYGGTFAFHVEFTVNQNPTVHTAVFNYAGELVGAS